MKRPLLRRLRAGPLAALLRGASAVVPPAGLAQSAAPTETAAHLTGSIEGRIANGTTGRFLANVRVSVEGTNLETFTDEIGQYRIDAVPVGSATVRVFFTGLRPAAQTAAVARDRTTVLDLQLEPLSAARATISA